MRIWGARRVPLWVQSFPTIEWRNELHKDSAVCFQDGLKIRSKLMTFYVQKNTMSGKVPVEFRLKLESSWRSGGRDQRDLRNLLQSYCRKLVAHRTMTHCGGVTEKYRKTFSSRLYRLNVWKTFLRFLRVFRIINIQAGVPDM